MWSVTIDEIDSLPGNVNASLRANETVQTGPTENPLCLAAIFQELKFGAHRAGGAVGRDILHRTVGNDPAGS